jgi:hypothetical protein
MYITGDLGDRSKITHVGIDSLPSTPYAGSSIGYTFDPANTISPTPGSSPPGSLSGDTVLPYDSTETPLRALGSNLRLTTPERNGIENTRYAAPSTTNGSTLVVYNSGMELSGSNNRLSQTSAVEGGVFAGGPAGGGYDLTGLGGGGPAGGMTTPDQAGYTTLAPAATAGYTVSKGRVYKELSEKSSNQAVYSTGISSLKQDSILFRSTANLSYNPSLVTDNLEDAKSLFSTTLDYAASMDTTKFTLVSTRIPCAVPGVLNAYAVRIDNNDRIPYNTATPYKGPVMYGYDVPDVYLSDLNWTQTFIGNGTANTFAISTSHMNILFPEWTVKVAGVTKTYSTDYHYTAVSGVSMNIVFNAAPVNGATITVTQDTTANKKQFLQQDYRLPDGSILPIEKYIKVLRKGS